MSNVEKIKMNINVSDSIKNYSTNNNSSNNEVSKINEANQKIDNLEIEEFNLNENVQDICLNTGTVSSNALSTLSGSNVLEINAEEWFQNDLQPKILNIAKNYDKYIQSTGATIGTFAMSFIEGFGAFFESLFDAGVILADALITLTGATVVFDSIVYLIKTINGQEYDFNDTFTYTLWESGMETVASKVIVSGFDYGYAGGIDLMKNAKDNSYWFDTTRNIGNGVGEVAGVIALTILTMGAGTAVTGASEAVTSGTSISSEGVSSVIAGVSGFGKGTEDSWSQGGTLWQGLGRGTLNGLWNGFQWYLGSKIIPTVGTNFSQIVTENMVEGTQKTIITKLIEMLARSSLDGIDGGLESFVQPLIDDLTDGKILDFNYQKYFEDDGGWIGFITNTLMGSTLSFLSEVPGLKNMYSNEQINNEIKLSDIMSDSEINRYNYLVEFRKNPEYQQWIYDAQNGYATILKKEWLNIEEEFADLQAKAIKWRELYNLINLKPEALYNDYVTNRYYMKESFLEYLSSKKIEVQEFGSKLDVATQFGDCKLYLIEKLKQQYNITKDQNLGNIIINLQNLKTGDIKIDELFNTASMYLSQQDMKIGLDIYNQGYSDNFAKSFDRYKQNSIFNYTNCGGFEINAFLGNYKMPQNNVNPRDLFRNIPELQDFISGANGNRTLHSYEANIVEQLDEIINSANYENSFFTYRGVKKLYSDGVEIDVDRLSIGDTINCDSFQSSSIIKEHSFAKHEDVDIVLEVIVLPNSGSAVYIENLSGVSNYDQMEVLIKRNSRMIVVDPPGITYINGVPKKSLTVLLV